jgi:hypothetical protein
MCAQQKQTVPGGPLSEKHRPELLLRTYDQMFNDINRHILVVWQSIGALVATLALFALVEKHVISEDHASTMIVIVCAWVVAHVYDAAYWYNWNLVIIANIERQFLLQSDIHDIHYYFGKHRAKHSILTHLKIQFWFAIGVALLVLAYHFLRRVVPGLGSAWGLASIEKALPYGAAVVCIGLLSELRRNRTEAYEEFVRNSPGIDVQTAGTLYGIGHPTDG